MSDEKVAADILGEKPESDALEQKIANLDEKVNMEASRIRIEKLEIVIDAVKRRADEAEKEASRQRTRAEKLEKLLNKKGRVKASVDSEGTIVYSGKSIAELQRENTKLKEEVLYLSSTRPDRVEKLQVRNKNKNLFERLAVSKAKLKECQDEKEKNLMQIKALSSHCEKLMAFVRVEAAAKASALEECRQLERQLLKEKRKQAKRAAKYGSERAGVDSARKNDKILVQQLELLDEKYMNLQDLHKQTRANLSRELRSERMKVRRMSDRVFELEKSTKEAILSRRNMFMGVLKCIESIYGGMDVCVVDLQECRCDDDEARVLADTLRTATERMKQKKEEARERDRKRSMNLVHANELEGVPHHFQSPEYYDPGKSNFPPLCINMAYNNITNDGAKALSGVLVGDTHVREVDVRCNFISNKGIRCFLDALRYNSDTKAVDLSGNDTSEQDLEEYLDEELLKESRSKSSHTIETSMEAITSTASSEKGAFAAPTTEFPSPLPRRSKSAPPARQRRKVDTPPTIPMRRRLRALKKRMRMHPPKSSAVSAVNRLVLDSATRKTVQKIRFSGPRIRPKSARIARHGGKEKIDTSPLHSAGKKSRTKRRPQSASSKTRYQKFASSNVTNRVRPRSALISSYNRRRAGLKSKRSPLRAAPALTNKGQIKNRSKMWDKSYLEGAAIKNGEEKEASHNETEASSSLSAYSEHPRQGSYASRHTQSTFTNITTMKMTAFYDDVTALAETELDDREVETGNTLLMTSIKENLLQHFSLLITCGCNVNCINNMGETALSIAALSKDRMHYFDPLFARGVDVNLGKGLPNGTVLHSAVRSGSLAVLCRVLEFQHLDINAVDNQGRTALHIAFIEDALHMARTLVQASADRDILDHFGKIAEEYQRD